MLLLLGHGLRAEEGGGLLAGVAKVDITPEMPVYLAGFGPHRLSKGVHDPLYARILIIKANETIGLVSLDLLGIWPREIEEIREATRSFLGGRLIIACTHNHSGPDLIGAWGPSLLRLRLLPYKSGVNRDYLNFLKERVIEGIKAAYGNLRRAELRFSSLTVEGIAKNIRSPASLDKELVVMQLRAISGGVIATVINFACHAEVLGSDNRWITADFPGYLYKKVEESLGGITLFFNGALGGMVTAEVTEHSFSEARRIGESLALQVLEAVKRAEDSPLPSISWNSREVFIPFENWRYRLARCFGIIERRLYEGKLRTEITVVEIGKGQIVTIPGELLPNLGLQIKAMMKAPYRMIFCVAGDELGYILSEKDFSKKLYSYERSMSVSRKAWPLLLQGLRPLLSKD